MEAKKTQLMAAALMAFSGLAAWADAPASQLSQAQTIMGSPASPETKVETLYNGGSAKSLGVAVPAQPDGSPVRHIDIGAAPAAGTSSLDQASMPSPAAPAQKQARFAFGLPNTDGLCQDSPTVPEMPCPVTDLAHTSIFGQIFVGTVVVLGLAAGVLLVSKR